MKRTLQRRATGLALAAALLLTLWPVPALAGVQQEDVFSVEIEEGAEYDGYIVKLRDENTPAEAEKAGLDAIVEEEGLYIAADLEEVENHFDSAEIEYIEPDYYRYTDGAVNDQFYADQWSLQDTGGDAVLERVASGELSAKGVRIAVVDSGIWTGHEDIDEAYIEAGKNYINNTTNVEDSYGHGTAVTSIIAATTDNEVGVASLGYGATIVPLKVTNDGSIKVSRFIEAVYDAVDVFDCDIINYSAGGGEPSEAEEEACRYACDNGVIIVSATGNEGTEKMNYPAGYDMVVGVGSVDRDRSRSTFSNYNSSVFAVAPGGQVLVAYPNYVDEGIYYATAEGTSFSAPFITALAALAKGYDSRIDGEHFMYLLRASVEDLGEPGWNEEYGWGLVDCELFADNLATAAFSVTVTAGEGGVAGSSRHSAAYGDLVTLTARPYDGYRLDHWAVVRGSVEIEDDQFIMTVGPVEIEAVFVPDVYTVTYDANGGEGESPEPEALAPGETLVVAESGFTAPQGQRFARWDTEADGTGTGFDPGDEVDMPEEDLILYAIWEDALVTFSAYIEGYEDGSFGPDDPATRAEAAKMFYTMAAGDGTIDETVVPRSGFSDVDPEEWYGESVAYLTGAGILEGYDDGTFRPDDTITRAEFTAMAVRYAGLEASGQPSQFPDAADHWASGYIRTATDKDYISGFPEGIFGPDEEITRAQAVVILNAVSGRTAAAEGGYDETVVFSDVTDDDWAWGDIVLAASTFTALVVF